MAGYRKSFSDKSFAERLDLVKELLPTCSVSPERRLDERGPKGSTDIGFECTGEGCPPSKCSEPSHDVGHLYSRVVARIDL